MQAPGKTQAVSLDLLHNRKQPIRHRRGFLRRKIHPHRGRTAGRVYDTGHVGALYGGPGLKAAASWFAHIHLDQHLARVLELLIKITKRVDDHRPFAIRQRRTTQRRKPINANSLQVTEIAGVVQMAHGIHVAPAYGHDLFIHPFFVLASMTSNASKSLG